MEAILAYDVVIFPIIGATPFLHDVVPIVVAHFAHGITSFCMTSYLLVDPYFLFLPIHENPLPQCHPLLCTTIFSTCCLPFTSNS